MTTGYEFEPSAASLLIAREALRRIAARTEEAKLHDIAKDARKHSDELGRQARKMLRELGFEKDCEIDAEMERLAIIAQDAAEELGAYIAKNSPNAADLLAKHGNRSLRAWQDAHPTPIRPDRRN